MWYEPTPLETAVGDQERAEQRDTVRELAEVLRSHLHKCDRVGCVGPGVAYAVLAMSCQQRLDLLLAALSEIAGDPRGEPDVELVVRHG